MEIRRIEGVLLQHATEQSQSNRTQRTHENLKVRLLSTVPQILLEASLNKEGPIRARVSHSEGGKLGLMLEDGTEINAENRSSLILKAGDMIELKVENTSPLTLKVVGVYRRVVSEEIINMVFEPEGYYYLPLSQKGLWETVRNSGIFYERKLFELFIGKLRPEELMEDVKAQVLKELIPIMKDLSAKLGVVYSSDLGNMKGLFETAKQLVQDYKRLWELFKVIKLEGLGHEEYAGLVRFFESRGDMQALKFLEEKKLHMFAGKLWTIVEKGPQNNPTLENFARAFVRLKEIAVEEGDVGLLVRNFLDALKGGSEESIKEAYKELEGFMERGKALHDFFQRYGHRTEQLLSRLDFITALQYTMLRYDNLLYIPVYLDGGKGSLLFKLGKEYLVVLKLQYSEGFVIGILRLPKAGKALDISILTDIRELAQAIGIHRDSMVRMIEEEGLKLGKFRVELKKIEEAKEEVTIEILREGFSLIA
ncbi:MAG: hypothetical protein D6674_03125 [Acidobacteria bacterium]|jgi:hypothetical protein|nr:MAG: hypothetical protein D6674_03125 [Acidobacteriota bacterium]